MKPEIIKIDDVTYVREDAVNKPAGKLDGMSILHCKDLFSNGGVIILEG